MHRKIRIYQSKLELSEIHNVKVEEKLKEINDIFTILGITLDDMKETCKTGVFKFGGINTKNFELSSVKFVSSAETSSKKLKNPNKKSQYSRTRSPSNPKRINFKNKGSSSSMTSAQALDLIRFPTNSESSDNNSEDVTSFLSIMTGLDRLNIKVDPPKSSIDCLKSQNNDSKCDISNSL